MKTANPLLECLRQEMGQGKVLSFARFMEIVLYQPGLGYYESPLPRIGSAGDYITSVCIGPVFGQLLGFQLAAWLEDLNPHPGPPLQIIEAGAHDGRLAQDILEWFHRSKPQLADRTEYWIMEPSGIKRAWQAERLRAFQGQVSWVGAPQELPPGSVDGVIFANELLDAMPAHVLKWDTRERCWREWGVALEGADLAWRPMRDARAEAGTAWPETLEAAGIVLSQELIQCLPEGFSIEVSPAAADWWRAAATALNKGWLLTLDYGHAADAILMPQRARGTLRAFTTHRASDDVLADPGARDITSHVNFTHIQRAGEQAGASTVALTSQAAFLTRILERTIAEKHAFDDWSPARVRQFQTLTHDEHLGRAFKALVQRKAQTS